MRVAIVCDWLTNTGGAEKTVLAIHKAFPHAPIYTSVFEPSGCPEFKNLDVRTTWLQKFPKFLRRHHQLFPVLRFYAFRGLDLREYDVIISAASAEAKAVRARPGAVHICYCHTPTRYYWSHYHDYKRNPGFGPLNPLIRLLIPPFVSIMRRADLRAARGVDFFIANSSAVATRIKKYYHRDAEVIHPPIEMQHFRKLKIDGPRTGFIMVGRQVPYKRFDLGIKACNQLGTNLTISSNGGPDHRRLVAMAGPSVHFVESSDSQKAKLLAKASGFIFPQEEDFGIVHIEAMAAGTPVIAYQKGGALDTIKPGKNGIFFEEQTVASLVAAIKKLQKTKFNHVEIRKFAENFSEERFIKNLQNFVKKSVKL